MNKSILVQAFGLIAALLCTNSVALEVKLNPEQDGFNVKHNNRMVRVERIQDQSHVVDSAWAKTSRKCPPFCAQPMQVAPGVAAAGEQEVFTFMQEKVNTGKGVLIDARIASFHQAGTIPGSINIEFKIFQKGDLNDDLEKAMRIIGATRRDIGFFDVTMDKALKGIGLETNKHGYWDFSDVKELMIWCNGPWCGQSPAAIRGLLELGFPAEKIHYYRGGMQMWQIMGLPVIKPE
jgi:rhodanese-related sulfurtransferase